MTEAMTTTMPAMGAMAIERARDAIAECKTIDAAKEIRDQAAAVKVYLRTKNAGFEAQNDAAEIVITAERRMGLLLSTTAKNKGGRPRKSGAKIQIATLSDLGVSRDTAARAQKLAEIDEETFHARLQKAKEKEHLTAAAVLGKKKSPGLQTRRTPRWLFDELAERFGAFELDAYAETHNALCPKFYTEEEDANVQPWINQTFANPEFEDMAEPTLKALNEWLNRGVVTIMIGPVGCSQDWYHQLAIRGTVFVPDKRINYDLPDGTPTTGADRDSIVMAFGDKHQNPHWQQGQFRVHSLKLKGPKDHAN